MQPQSCFACATALLLVLVDGKTLRASSEGKCEGVQLQDCYLRNLDTQEEYKVERDTTGILSYPVHKEGSRYSMRCEVSDGIDKLVHNHPIASDQKQYISDKAPFWWTNGGEGEWVNAVRHLSNCGPKPIQVFGYVGEEECFAEEFTIEATCDTELCSFQCPYYSAPREGHTCLSAFDNCECEYSYKLVNNYCIKDWCYHDFQCPEGKERVPGRDCYTGPRDCKFKPRSFLDK